MVQPVFSERENSARAKFTFANDCFNGPHCEAASTVLHMRTYAASAIAASAQVRFVPSADTSGSGVGLNRSRQPVCAKSGPTTRPRSRRPASTRSAAARTSATSTARLTTFMQAAIRQNSGSPNRSHRWSGTFTGPLVGSWFTPVPAIARKHIKGLVQPQNTRIYDAANPAHSSPTCYSQGS